MGATSAEVRESAPRTGWVWNRGLSSGNVARFFATPTSTPLAWVMVSILLLAALTLRLDPGDLDSVVAWTSTNVHNLSHHPFAAMIASTFVVPGNLMPELVIVGVSFAVLERAVGSARTAIIALCGQVFATLLTEYGTEIGAHLHLLSELSPERSDVGVSYVMYAVLAAGIMSLDTPARTAGMLLVGVLVVVSFLLSPGMTTTGHLLSVAIGSALMTSLSGSSAAKQLALTRLPSSPSATWNWSHRPMLADQVQNLEVIGIGESGLSRIAS